MAGSGRPYPVDAEQNPSFAYSYTSGQLTQIDMTVLTRTWRKTFTFTGEDLTAETDWALQ